MAGKTKAIVPVTNNDYERLVRLKRQEHNSYTGVVAKALEMLEKVNSGEFQLVKVSQ